MMNKAWWQLATNVTAMVEDPDETCRSLNTLANVTAKCAFIQGSGLCEYDGLVLDYLELSYCTFHKSLPEVLLVLGCLLFFYFLCISLVADDFMCPSLLTMSKTLRMPDHIAGATFLAFGNGAPDIFSSIGGIAQSKSSLIFSSLFGGGIFVTTVVTGAVLLSGDFAVMKRPIVRDIVFYIGASFTVWIFIYYEKLTIYHSISLVVFYLVYIVILVSSRFIYLHKMKKSTTNVEINVETASEVAEHELDNRSVKSMASGPASRKHSTASGISFRYSPDPKLRAASYEDDVILTRFHRKGTLRTPRRRQRSIFPAHHRLENSLNHITRIYENARKQGLADDVRYKDRAETSEVPSTSIATINNNNNNDGIMQSNVARPHVNEIKFTNNFGRPKYLQQFSSTSMFSISSSEALLNMVGETKEFFIHICPIDYMEWPNYPWHKKIMDCIKALPYLCLTLCIPVVDLESPKENWCRILICLNLIVGPQAVVFLLQLDHNLGHLPLWAFFLILSVTLVIVVVFTSTPTKAPVYHRAFGFMGFIVSVVFINTIVDEIISILETLGILFDLSDSIIGLTILAWGNSLGDIFADLAMARNGYPGMAISACFGSPMLNLLMGLGIPYTIMFAKGEKTSIVVRHTHMISLLYATITTVLCFTLFSFIINRFRSTKIHGFVLIVLYSIYLLFAFLIEFHVISKNTLR